MGYVSFLTPKAPPPPPAPTDRPEPVEFSPVASTSKLARSPSPPPPPPTVATAPVHQSPKAAAAANGTSAGPSRTNGKRPRIVSYLSDDEHEPAQDGAEDDDDETGVAAARRPSQTASKVARTTANGDAGSRHAKGKARGGPSAVDKERLRAEKERLKTTRMELPIWDGASWVSRRRAATYRRALLTLACPCRPGQYRRGRQGERYGCHSWRNWIRKDDAWVTSYPSIGRGVIVLFADPVRPKRTLTGHRGPAIPSLAPPIASGG
jgi:hypothetical protein